MPHFNVNKIYCGHVLDVLRKFPDNSIDVVVTSPPYWNLRDYKIPPSIFGGKIDCKHEWVDEKTWHDNLRFRAGENTQVGNQLNPKIFGDPNVKSGFCLRCGAWRGELGLEPDPQLYVKHLVEIMHEVRRVLKPSGSLFLNLGDGYYGRHGMGNCDADSLGFQKGLYKEFPLNVKYPTEKGGWLQPKQLMGLPERIMIGMQEDGWILRNKVIWHKRNHTPASVKDRLTNSYEFVYFFVKNNEPLWYYNTKTGATSDRRPEMSVEGVDYYLKGKRKISFWHGFRYFFDLDAIRVPAKTAHEMLERKTKPFGKRSSPGYRHAPVGESYNPAGKNPGDFLDITTKGFKGAHFAVFPEALVEPMLKAGCPREVCKKCGKPRFRIVKSDWKQKRLGTWKQAENIGKEMQRPDVHRQANAGGLSQITEPSIRTTVGWTDCGCNAGFEPGIVLDIFMGSGTTAVVAKKMSLNFVGIEIKREYCEIARNRLKKEFPNDNFDQLVIYEKELNTPHKQDHAVTI
jgi:DNA modification methylase